MPVDNLPPSAQAMYSQWWTTVAGWANQVNPDTGRAYSVTDVSAAASILRQEFPQTYTSYSPPGVSALYSVALRITNATEAIASAPPGSPITPDMIAEPPWSRPAGEQEAVQVWQARAEITYISDGIEHTGITTITIPQVLPVTVDSLRAQVELRAADQLASPPGTGTPRSGDLVAVGGITLLQV